MKHIFDIEYKLLAIKTLFERFYEINELPAFICYKNHYIENGQRIDVDFFNTTDYEEEIRTSLLDKNQKGGVLSILKEHIVLSRTVMELITNFPANISSKNVVSYFTYKKDRKNPLSDFLIIKKDNDTGQILFYNPFMATRTNQLWNEDISEWIILSRYNIHENDIFDLNPINRNDDLIEICDAMFTILPRKVKKIIDNIGNENIEQTDKVYFDMGMISQIHKICNGIYWKPIKDNILYDTLLDPLKYSNTIQIRSGGAEKVYFLFDRLNKSLPESLRKQWIEDLLQSANIKSSIYYKKYTSARSSNTTKNNKDFVKIIDNILSGFGFYF